jgi:hypothetical protein
MFASKYSSALYIGLYCFHIGLLAYIKEKDYIDQNGDCHVEKEAYSILGQSTPKLHNTVFVSTRL